MNPITIPNITIPVIGLPTIGIPSVGFPSASGGGLVWPKGLKESIKAIYDPAKQGMTNYDVIEAYVEDFTNWNYVKARGTATVSQHKFIITECVLNGLGIVEDTQEPYSNLTVRITGITDNQGVLITDYVNGQHQIINTITEDGIYTIEDRHHFIGFGCNFVGTCNITIEQLPTSILKDLSGNGNHAYLYGGKGKLNSGMGVYNYVFNNGRNVQDSILNKKYTVYINDTPVNGNLKFKVVTLNPNTIDFSFEIVEKDVDGKVLSYNGMKTPTDIVDFKPRDNTATIQLRIRYDSFATTGDIQLGIQLLPNAYPNQLCYDGKMYAVCYGFPILEDYTIMADRTWFKNVGCFAGKRSASDNKGAFVFENNSSNGFVCYNYGGVNNINRVDNKITYQTIHDYNGQAINRANSVDTDFLLIGGGLYRPTTNSFDEFWQGCHGKIIIADRSLTEDEITWLKNNLFTIEIPTPAYDFDFSKLKSGENTFTDKYGNELSLYNFQWAGMSGKDGYIEDFAVWGKNTERYTGSITNKTINITEVSKANSICVYTSPKKQNIKLYITGLITGQNIILGNADVPSTVGNIIVSENGLYDIDESQFNQYFGIGFGFTGDCNITITQLPLYPNALVFDGVDDYCKLPKMTIKSVILDVVPLYIGNDMLYDCRTGGDMNAFGIYNEADIVAYSARNDGKTYINGELNTTLTALDIGINRQIVCVTNDNAVEHEQFIGSSISVNSVAKMALYRITGFTEVLTPDQVWKWYQKNKPKGGDK